MAQFSDIGSNCFLKTCKERDFLPFECEYCKEKFCLTHRTPESHECQVGVRLQQRVSTTKCPKCSKVLRVPPLGNPESVLFDHSLNKCHPEVDSLICAALNCRIQIKPSNSITCSTCRKKVCLKHRYEDAHQCRSIHSPSEHWICKNCRMKNLGNRTLCAGCGTTVNSVERNSKSSSCTIS